MAAMGVEEVFLSRISIHFTFVPGLEKTCYMKIVGMGIMRNSIQIKLYDIFRKDLHLADERARELVQTIDQAVKGEYEDNLEGVATKDFVKDEIQATKEFVRERFHILDLKIEQTKVDLEIKIEQVRSDLTKAIYISNLIQFLAIVGSVIAIINFMQHK
jgi:hypothetical protein